MKKYYLILSAVLMTYGNEGWTSESEVYTAKQNDAAIKIINAINEYLMAPTNGHENQNNAEPSKFATAIGTIHTNFGILKISTISDLYIFYENVESQCTTPNNRCIKSLGRFKTELENYKNDPIGYINHSINEPNRRFTPSSKPTPKPVVVKSKPTSQWVRAKKPTDPQQNNTTQ